MSIIHPFKAIRPHPPHAAEVSCPPYDVISTTEARLMAWLMPWQWRWDRLSAVLGCALSDLARELH